MIPPRPAGEQRPGSGAVAHGGDAIDAALKKLHRLNLDMGDPRISYYIEETEKCVRADAHVGAMSTCWNVLMTVLYKKIEEYGIMDFNALAINHSIKASGHVSSGHDLNRYSDHDIIVLCEKMSLYDRNIAEDLQAHRRARNSVAHVSQVRPSTQRVALFIDDMDKYARHVSAVRFVADERLIGELLALDADSLRARVQLMPPALAISCVRKAAGHLGKAAAGRFPEKGHLAVVDACISLCRSENGRLNLMRALSDGLLGAGGRGP